MDTGTGSTSDTGMMDSTTGDTTSDTGMMDTTTTTGGNMVCDPEIIDNICVECVKANCCTQLEACIGDVACSCAYDCVTQGNDPVQCQADCGANNAVSNALLLCGQLSCGAECIP
jgi:hypothetical protein